MSKFKALLPSNRSCQDFKVNNFDLIRLIAAMQVAFSHAMYYLKIENKSLLILTEIVGLFPGVPIFFFVSGFLISKSYENNSLIKEYAKNRLLRIYPGLIVCTFIAILSVYWTGYFTNINVNLFQILIWIIGQISFIQFYSPHFMREFATGFLNGSLWTIQVELQFYILVPIIYYILKIAFKKNIQQNIVLIALVSFFMAINVIYHTVNGQYTNKFLVRIFWLWGNSFSPWFYMFLVGIFFQKNCNAISRVLYGRFYYILITYISFNYLATKYFGWHGGNKINPVLYFLLSILVFSFAYSFPRLSDLLKKNDISYGVYIYHMPIINLFIYFGYTSNTSFVLIILVLTIIVASISWVFIENPAIKLKKHPLNPH